MHSMVNRLPSIVFGLMSNTDSDSLKFSNDITKHFCNLKDVSIQKAVSKDFNDDLIVNKINPQIRREISDYLHINHYNTIF
ncbi:MAG: hypothetical protein ACRCR9_01685 [Chitinophagaceae bacterium]